MAARVLRWVAALTGIAVGLLAAAAVALFVLTRTPWGMERARGVALSWLSGQVNGRVTLERITGDGLLGGATIHGLSITDSAGRPFVRVDSLRARYDVRNLLFGRIVLEPVTLYGPSVHVTRPPGDTAWNYERLFGGGEPADTVPGPARLIRFDDVRIVGGSATVIRPYVGTMPRRGADAKYVVLDTLGGPAQVMRFEALDGRLSRVVWSAPGQAGRSFEVDRLKARVTVLETAFEVHDLSGTITQQDSVVGIDVRRFRLPSSSGRVSGRVIIGKAGTRYDLGLDGQDVAFADLGWIDARLPSTGSARFRLGVETADNGSLVLSFNDIGLKASGTSATGRFGYVTGDRPELRDVDLRLSPVSIAWLNQFLPDSVPLDGALTGRLRATGPLSAVRTTGDLRWSNGQGRGSPAVRWSGGLRLGGGAGFRQLSAELTAVDLALIERFRPGLGLEGTLDGRVDLAGGFRSGVELRALLRHSLAGEVSDLDGTGTIAMSETGARLDLRIEARPFRLETLARRVPQLEGLRGDARGTLAVAGTPDSLDVAGDLATPGGSLVFASRIDRRAEEPRFAVEARSGGFDPGAIGFGTAGHRVSGAISMNMTAASLERMRGPAIVRLDSARIAGFPLERSFAALTIAEGRAHVDSATLRAPGLRAAVSGAFGLVAERADTLRIDLSSESLEPLERVLFDEVVDATTARVSGSARATALIAGSLAAFDVRADAVLDHPEFDGRSAARARLALRADGVRTDRLGWSGSLHADSLRALDGFVDSVSVAYEDPGGTGALRIEAWRAGERTLRADAAFVEDEQGTDWRITGLQFRSGPGEWTLAGASTVRLEARTARVTGLRLLPNVGGEVSADGRLAWGGASPAPAGGQTVLDFDVELRDVPFGLVPAVLRPVGDVRGSIGGAAHVGGTTNDPMLSARLTIANLEYEGSSLERVEASIDYAGRRMRTRLDAFVGNRAVLNGEGEIPVDLRFGPVEERLLAQPLDLRLRMDSFPAAFAFGLVSGFRDIQGVFDGQFETGGTSRDPELTGALALRSGGATWDATGVRYADAQGTFLMDRQLRAAIDFSARTLDPRRGTRAGTARITGTIDLDRPTDPGFDLELAADRILAARRRDMELTASGRVTIDGRYTRPRIGGELRIDGGTLYLDELYRQYLIVQLEDPFLLDVVDTSLVSVQRVLPETTSPFLKNLLIQDASVVVGAGSWLRSREMNVEVEGELTVAFDRQAEDLRMLGSLRVIRGTYRLEYPPFARVFEVRQGSVEFPGTPGVDPNLRIGAVYTARTGGEPLDIVAEVTGTLRAPRVTLRSDAQPPISESDLASYLFFGAPTYAFNIASPGGGNLFGSLGERALAATGLGYFASGLQTLGQSFGLVDYVGLTAAEAAPSAGAESGIGQLLSSTKIELGRYLTPSLFVTYTQRLNSPANDPGVRLEWRFHPTYTVELFSEDRFARAPSFGLSQAILARRVFGFFLYREWGY